ncbi:MAG: AraC family transcriptional regulator [Solobacterium sp.]|nr:AraC family transcriptional regulator [Solobacterium sp.]
MNGNIIYCTENYIAGISDTFGAKLHRHPLIEIYAACDGNSHIISEQDSMEGEIIVVGANTEHAISDTGKPGIALFLDPLTETGYSLGRNTLTSQPICTVGADDDLRTQLKELPGSDLKHLQDVCETILERLCGDTVKRPFDKAVLQTIDLLGEEDCEYDMNILAESVFLSKSRLAHVFSLQTGITLKEYLQYKRLERACRKMLKGQNITEAAGRRCKDV